MMLIVVGVRTQYFRVRLLLLERREWIVKGDARALDGGMGSNGRVRSHNS